VVAAVEGGAWLMQAKFICTVCIHAGLIAGISASTAYYTGASICGALKGGSRFCFFNSIWTWVVLSTSPLFVVVTRLFCC
jgi:hypothetical protein